MDQLTGHYMSQQLPGNPVAAVSRTRGCHSSHIGDVVYLHVFKDFYIHPHIEYTVFVYIFVYVVYIHLIMHVCMNGLWHDIHMNIKS